MAVGRSEGNHSSKGRPLRLALPRVDHNCDYYTLYSLPVLSLAKAWFRRRTFHVPNLTE